MAIDRGFVHLEELRLLANSTKLRDQLLVYFDIKTQRESQLATELNNLTRNLLAYKTREELKGMQKDDLIKAMEMRKVALQLHL
ncbi:hypothetical protein Tco_1237835 [Tanacetum coccineum]